jgi:zinc protease
MQLNYLYYTALNKDEKAFESWKKRTAAIYGNILNSPQVKFSLAFSDFVNQNNPRYVGILPTPEKLETQDYETAYKTFREFYDGATDYHYYIVGNFDEAETEQLIKTYIGGLPQSARKGEFVKHPDYALKGKHEFIYHAGKDPKSMVIIIMSGKADYSGKEKLKLKILGEILTNKLIEKLREEVSGVYGVGARGTMRKLPHSKFSFSITFPCGPENARKLSQMALAELNNLIENGPSEEDLMKVKKSLLVQFDEKIQTNEFWLDYLSDTDYLNADPHRINNYKQTVESITPGDIKAVGKKYLRNPETQISAIWYPEGFEDKK